MEREFVPYDIALAMKELGFNEKSFGYYTKHGEFFYFDVDDLSTHYTKNLDNLIVNSVDGLECTTPLYQQAFRWFREKHNILGKVRNLNTHTIKHQYYAEIVEPITVSSYSIYDSYEEAELECLRKLIEVVKENL